MKMLRLILTVTAGALLAAPARAQDRANPRLAHEKAPTNKVKELQKERIAALKALADLSNHLFQTQSGSLEAVLEARLLVFEAELDAAETESKRLTLYRNLVDVLKDYENVAIARKQAARGTEASVLRVKAKRLEAEIHLERAMVRTADLDRPRVVTTNPIARDVTITQQYACQIHAGRHIEVRSQLNGYLEEIPLLEGQAVKQGELLFKLVPTHHRARLDAELAELKVADLELSDADRLAKNKTISTNEVERVRAKREKAQAKVKLAEAELNLTMVRAPFDGLVDRLYKQQGSLISERDVLTTLSDNHVIWVYCNIPEARYLEYKASRDKHGEDEPIELRLADGTKFPHAGKIAAIEAEFNSETGTIAFRVDFPNPDGLLRHGQTGTVVMRRVLKNAIVIPQRATFAILARRYVYVVDKDDVAHRREVVINHELGDLQVVKQGLGVGDRFVLEGVRQVRDGEKVTSEFRNQ